MQMWQRVRRFSMDAELDKHFKEAWCKRHSLNHPRLAAYASAVLCRMAHRRRLLVLVSACSPHSHLGWRCAHRTHTHPPARTPARTTR